MTAPIIWIVFPLLVSLLLFLVRSSRLLALIIGGGVSALLALLALTFKIDSVFPLGPLSIEITSTLNILGRNFTILDSDRFMLALFFAMSAFWILGSRISGVNSFFIPNSLAIITLFVAALSVQPFLYAALIIEIAVLISIPTFFVRGEPVKQGVIRFLIFQTLAVPFILISGRGFELAPSSIDSQAVYFQAGILLAIGIGLWLAIFPFYTWVPLLAGDGHSYSAGFIFSMLPTAVLIFFLEFFNSYNWLREQVELFSIIQAIGIIMVVLGGLFAAFQRSITKILGYAVIAEIGFSLLALSLNQTIGWQSYIFIMIPRLISIAICSLAISIWKNHDLNLDLDHLQGLQKKFPLATMGFLVGWFTFSGLPLLPGFPTKLPILIGLSSESFQPIIFVSIGLFGIFVAGFRFIAVAFVDPKSTDELLPEPIIQKIFFVLGILILVAIGLFPSIFLNPFDNLLLNFSNLN